MRRNLIYGSICLAALSCFAVLAVAQQRPAAPQQPAATPQPAPAQPDAAPAAGPQNVPTPQNVTVQEPRYTHSIEIPPGITIRFESPRPFASVVAGDTRVADAVPGPTDRLLVVTSKVIGATNFLLTNGNGQEVANLLVNVTYGEAGRVQIHNKKLVTSYTVYRCTEKRCQYVEEVTAKEPAELPRGYLNQNVDQNITNR
jgi:Flp pilus assembly secretin CpaC